MNDIIVGLELADQICPTLTRSSQRGAYFRPLSLTHSCIVSRSASSKLVYSSCSIAIMLSLSSPHEEHLLIRLTGIRIATIHFLARDER